MENLYFFSLDLLKVFFLVYSIHTLFKAPLSLRKKLLYVTLSLAGYFLSYSDPIINFPGPPLYMGVFFILALGASFYYASIFILILWTLAYFSQSTLYDFLKGDKKTFPLLIALVLTFTEIMYALTLNQYNFTLIGLPLIAIPGLKSFPFYFSAFSLTFLMVLFCCLPWYWRQRSLQRSLLLTLVVGIGLFYGHKKYENKPLLSCVPLQTKLHTATKLAQATVSHLSSETKNIQGDPDLILWPEGMQIKGSQIDFKNLLKPHQHLIIGESLSEKQKLYNAMSLYNHKGDRLHKYKKTLLVPLFEEGVLEKLSLINEKMKQTNASHYKAADQNDPWILNNVSLLPYICWEILKPVWPTFKYAPKIVLSIGNESLVRSAYTKYRMYLFNKLKAAEHGATLCRSVNDGYRPNQAVS